MSKILLLDGNSLLYRAFFAIPDDMGTAAGTCTNAVYGFTSMLVNLLRDHQPDAMAVAFDLAGPTFRHEMVDDYKAGRPETPDTLGPQFDLVKELLEALGIPVAEAPGYEADDVIATLAARARNRGDDAVVVSGDRDTFQLVSDPHVRVLYNKRGVTDYELYDEAGIEARTGVPPSRYVVYAALRGDPSDNLPGVPGVGEKTAARLVGAYGDLDGIYAHVDDLTPKLRENLVAHEAQARSNVEMMPLVEDVPVDLGPADERARLGRWDTIALGRILDELEFRGLRRRLLDVIGLEETSDGKPATSADGASAAQPDLPAGHFPIVAMGPTTPECVAVLAVLEPVLREPRAPRTAGDAADALRDIAERSSVLGVHATWAADRGRSELVSLAVVGMDRQARAAGAVHVEGARLATATVRAALRAVLSSEGVGVVGHRVKELMRSLGSVGVGVCSLATDVAVAGYLLDPAGGHYELEDLAHRYGAHVGAAPDGDVARAGICLALAPVLRDRLAAEGMLDLYDTVENPLVEVLAAMEIAGIAVDAGKLRKLNASLAAEVSSLDEQIQKDAGVCFKVNSTPQLRAVLYDTLKLAPSKKTKTGYSTDAASLERLRGTHPIIEKLLRYREVEKLRSTYGTGLLAEVDPGDGRIHASFHQTVARTGRLSSDRPNLHNIPVRTEDGRRFREAFVPAKGCRFLVADYNQVELRVIAHLSGDPGLREAFTSGQDIHTATASRIFGVDPSDVTVAQRSKAKMVSYGLSYGMESFGLASRLGIGVDEARTILDAFFASFPQVKSYMDRTVAEARERGYTVTALGRRRPIPELASSNRQVRLQGERQAMNAGIQGLAADLFKIALVRLARALDRGSTEARIVLQVHDEVVVEAPAGGEEEVEAACRSSMEGALELSVPLSIEVAWGDTWAAAKS